MYKALFQLMQKQVAESEQLFTDIVTKHWSRLVYIVFKGLSSTSFFVLLYMIYVLLDLVVVTRIAYRWPHCVKHKSATLLSDKSCYSSGDQIMFYFERKKTFFVKKI